jgi:hypothetical protein
MPAKIKFTNPFTVPKDWYNINSKGCWIWSGYTHYKGCGYLTYSQRVWRAPRFIWTMINGDIPKGKYVLHSCDNPSCVNPDHLRIGTQSENLAEAVAKGRREVPIRWK